MDIKYRNRIIITTGAAIVVFLLIILVIYNSALNILSFLFILWIGIGFGGNIMSIISYLWYRLQILIFDGHFRKGMNDSAVGAFIDFMIGFGCVYFYVIIITLLGPLSYGYHMLKGEWSRYEYNDI